MVVRAMLVALTGVVTLAGEVWAADPSINDARAKYHYQMFLPGLSHSGRGGSQCRSAP